MSAASKISLCFVVAIAAWWPGSATAYTCITGSCPAWCSGASYGITVSSDDLGDGSSVTEARRGMEDWGRVGCANLSISYTGRSSATAGAGDGNSVIGWVERGWRHDPHAIGVTGPRWTGRNCIVEADMELNGVDFTWTTDPGRVPVVNAYSVVLHEGGHYYGLGHSSDSSATMYYSYSGGIDSITSDDQSGICALYPGGTGSTDCTETGCPAGQECVDGSCRPITGDGSVCSRCSSNSDCGGRNDLCLGYPDGVYYCGEECSRDADCGGAPQRCVSLRGTSQCVRFTGSSPSCADTGGGCTSDADCPSDQRCNAGMCEPRPTDLAPLGAACAEGGDCNSGVCFGGVCTQSCDWLDISSCPSGFYCDGDATGSCGTGICLAGTAGTGGLGDSCGQDTECTTLMCDRGRCSSPCIPRGAAACPEGYTCQVGAVAGCGGCHSGLGRTGDPCTDNDQCETGLCATRGGTDEGFCTEICGDVEDCPTGFSCEDAGGVMICVPPAGPAPGELGFPCGSNSECDSGICAVEGDNAIGFCTQVCDESNPCPEGHECRTAGATAVCVPLTQIDGGCGCVVAGRPDRGPSPLWFFLVVVPAIVWLRRRNRSG